MVLPLVHTAGQGCSRPALVAVQIAHTNAIQQQHPFSAAVKAHLHAAPAAAGVHTSTFSQRSVGVLIWFPRKEVYCSS